LKSPRDKKVFSAFSVLAFSCHVVWFVFFRKWSQEESEMYRNGIFPDADQSKSLRQSDASLPLLNLKNHIL
jgi:hypothetical protein